MLHHKHGVVVDMVCRIVVYVPGLVIMGYLQTFKTRFGAQGLQQCHHFSTLAIDAVAFQKFSFGFGHVAAQATHLHAFRIRTKINGRQGRTVIANHNHLAGFQPVGKPKEALIVLPREGRCILWQLAPEVFQFVKGIKRPFLPEHKSHEVERPGRLHPESQSVTQVGGVGGHSFHPIFHAMSFFESFKSSS